jgi:hypothetical protein
MDFDPDKLVWFNSSQMRCKACGSDDIQIVVNSTGTTIDVSCLGCRATGRSKAIGSIPMATYEELDAELKRRGM